MIPVVDNAHSAEAQALLTSMFVNQPNISKFLKALSNRIQDIENAAWGLINGTLLSNASGKTLDNYGSLVGVQRLGLSDADFLVAIKLKIRTDISSGTPEDILHIAALALTSFSYAEFQPAGWTLYALNVSNPAQLLIYLALAKAAGTKGIFQYSTPAMPNVIIRGSTVGYIPAYGLMDHISGQFPNVPISSQDLG